MDEELDKLAFRLFKLFAQYEAALKKQKYFCVSKRGEIIIEWDKFANEKVGGDFRNKLEALAVEADYILENPPKKQIVNEKGEIEWQVVSSGDKTVQVLFWHIRRTRNNLFHGAKFEIYWSDPERDKKLMESSLAILEHFSSMLGIAR